MDPQPRKHSDNVDALGARGNAVRSALAAFLETVGSDPDEQDLAQETVRKVIEAAPTLRATTAAEVSAFVLTTHRNVKRDAARRAQTRAKHVIPDGADAVPITAPADQQPLDRVMRSEQNAKQAVVLAVASETMASLGARERCLVLARLRGTPTLRELGEPHGMTTQQVWREQVRAMRALLVEVRVRLRTEHPDVYEYFFPWDAQ